jgi:hypothetical protein
LELTSPFPSPLRTVFTAVFRRPWHGAPPGTRGGRTTHVIGDTQALDEAAIATYRHPKIRFRHS